MSKSLQIQKLAGILRIIMFVLVTIGVAMIARRVLVIYNIIPSFSPNGEPPFDSAFAKHPAITLLHILPGLLFMTLGPWQFIPRIRNNHIRFHRISGTIFIVASYIVGISALCMPFIMMPIGGVNEAAGTILFAIFFLIALSRAWWYILNKNQTLHREWMIRAFAVGLAVSTIRPIIGLFFGLSGLSPHVFFGTAFWIGFTLHLIVAEVWINYTRPVSYL